MVLGALELLLPKPLLEHDGPSTVIAAINAQANDNRWVVHVLHYVPERRSETIDVIEDVIPLHDLTVRIRVPGKVQSVVCQPQGERLSFTQSDDGQLTATIPRINGHEMIAILFA